MIEIIKSNLNEPVIEAIGWTLFHSLWQITLVVILLVILLEVLRNQTARTRYAVACLAMITCVGWSSITFTRSYLYAKEKQKLAEQIRADKEKFKQQLYESLSKEFIKKPQTERAKTASVKVKFRGTVQRTFPIVVLLWFLGMGLFIIRLSGALIWLQKLKTSFTQQVDEDIKRLSLLIAGTMGVNKNFEVLKSGIAGTSMIVGYIKPVILLPFTMVSGLSPKELEAVLAHEIAHIKRNDYIINILQSVIEALFFFHPAMWVISKSIRNERENSCDELAVAATNDKVSYLKALTHAWELTNNKPNNYQVAFTSKKGNLLQRAINIKNSGKMKKNVTEGFIAASLVFFSLILISFSFENPALQTENSDSSDSLGTEEIVDSKSWNKPVPNLDSINHSIATSVEAVPEELSQAIEIAYTTNDDNLAEIINEVMQEVQSEVNMKEIMKEVKASIKEANISEEISKGFAEAYAELDGESEDSAELTKAALELAETTINSIDVEAIVTQATQTAADALEAVDLEAIIKEAMNVATEALEQIDYDEIEDDIQEALRDIDTEEINEEVIEGLEEIDLQEILGDIQEALKEIPNDIANDISSANDHSENNEINDDSNSEKEEDLEQLLRDMEKDQ